MKQKFLTLLFAILALSVNAANLEKEYKNYVENYDVAIQVKYIDSINPAEFWKTTIENNELCIKFEKDLQKNKGAEKEAIDKMTQLPKFYPQFDESIVQNNQGFCDSLLMVMGISELNIPCSLHVIDSDVANSFTARTEDGFAICITSALFNKKGINNDILKGYVACEFVHGVLSHHSRTLYAQAKQRREGNKSEAVATGILVGLAVLDAAVNNYPDGGYYNNYENTVINIDAKEEKTTSKYLFPYLESQIFEADLIAYRFLEHLGCGVEYINGLRIIGASFDDSQSNNQKNIETRIGFIKYVQQHPELGNTVNLKLAKKRLKNEAKKRNR